MYNDCVFVQVAEAIAHPFGHDEDDFQIGELISRHIWVIFRHRIFDSVKTMHVRLLGRCCLSLEVLLFFLRKRNWKKLQHPWKTIM